MIFAIVLLGIIIVAAALLSGFGALPAVLIVALVIAGSYLATRNRRGTRVGS